MERKDFIKLTAFSGIYLGAPESFKGRSDFRKGSSALTAARLQEFLTSLVPLGAGTVDKIIIGDPDTIIKKTGTCWMPSWDTCKKAVASGINVLVTHEPTFYTHRDLEEVPAFLKGKPRFTRDQYLEQIEKKKKWIIDNGLVIIRNHDTLDALKSFGIPFAFGHFLGFNDKDIIASRTYYNVYRFKAQPASSFAGSVAVKLREIGQPGVAFYGDPEREVSSVGIGTGWICDPMDYADLKPDVFIAIDDVIRTHIQTLYAEDSGHPLIVINHGTSEEMGMRSLNRIIKEKYPDMDVLHLSQGCTYEWITA